MLQLAEEVQRIVGTHLPLKFEPLPQDDPRQRQPDISKARRLLGWEPKVRLAEGLTHTIEYFRSISRT
jgi:nucleoside-diphosphate-sugar epimerase